MPDQFPYGSAIDKLHYRPVTCVCTGDNLFWPRVHVPYRLKYFRSEGFEVRKHNIVRNVCNMLVLVVFLIFGSPSGIKAFSRSLNRLAKAYSVALWSMKIYICLFQVLIAKECVEATEQWPGAVRRRANLGLTERVCLIKITRLQFGSGKFSTPLKNLTHKLDSDDIWIIVVESNQEAHYILKLSRLRNQIPVKMVSLSIWC